MTNKIKITVKDNAVSLPSEMAGEAGLVIVADQIMKDGQPTNMQVRATGELSTALLYGYQATLTTSMLEEMESPLVAAGIGLTALMSALALKGDEYGDMGEHGKRADMEACLKALKPGLDKLGELIGEEDKKHGR